MTVTGASGRTRALRPGIGVAELVSATLDVAQPVDVRPGQAWSSRAFDLVVTMLLLPAAIGLGAVIAVAIFIDSPGHVIFRSRRVGRNGQPFEMLKFRKMRVDAQDGPITLSNDERFTPIGRFLAATRLDELPQIWNVLRGEMRLVGPRPELELFVRQFAQQYEEILTCTPGITGPAQLLFFDESRLLQGSDPASIYREHVLPVKLLIDLDYVRRTSVARDLWLIARTVLLPFKLLVDAARRRPSLLRSLASATGGALILIAGFLLTSSNVV